MAILKNHRHKAFAQAMARGMSAAAAYVEATKPMRPRKILPNMLSGRSNVTRENACHSHTTTALAGLTQNQLAQAVGVCERAARYWELKNDKSPTSTISTLEKIEAVLHSHGGSYLRLQPLVCVSLLICR
jgi:hypothetical protein